MQHEWKIYFSKLHYASDYFNLLLIYFPSSFLYVLVFHHMEQVKTHVTIEYIYLHSHNDD